MPRRIGLMVVMTAGLALAHGGARAQDVPGIEICTVEKTMERRTSCLQSNVNFLQASLGKLSQEQQRRLDAANRQIEALRGTVTALQKTVDELKAAQPTSTPAKEAAPATSAAPAKEPAAK